MSVAVLSVLFLSFLTITAPVHSTAIIVRDASPASYQLFGNSIDSAAGLLIVGQPYYNGQTGEVFVFDGTTGSLIETFFSPNAQPGGGFGTSVEVEGGLLFAGAPHETVNGFISAGRVYAFDVKTGALLDTLVSSDPQFSGDFGVSLDLAGRLLAIGASFETVNGVHAGQVHVFDARTGLEIATLVSPNPENNGFFGADIGISNGRIIVGAPQEQSDAGRAYVFSAATGALVSTLVSPNSPNESRFGASVAIANQQAFVGSPTETVGVLMYSGSVYVFNALTSSLVRTITDPNAQSLGDFGQSLALVGNSLIVGAPFDLLSLYSSARGRVYVFSSETDALTGTLVNPDLGVSGSFGYFGESVDSTNGRIYIGAPAQVVNGQLWAGSVYIFE